MSQRATQRRREATEPRSLTWATTLDALGLESVLEPRDGYLLVRTPQRPDFWWGNMLIFERAPRGGDGDRWERRFEEEFADDERVRHRTFAWDTTDGDLGAAAKEFGARGYDVTHTVGLRAGADEIRPHPRANREVSVRRLDPGRGHDEELWTGALAVNLADGFEGVPPQAHRRHREERIADLRELFMRHGGGWYVALAPDGGQVLAACGLVRAGERLSIHDVDTLAAHRRMGICSRLLVEAIEEHVAREGVPAHVVIGADPGYHALGLYESLGFEALERCAGVCRTPASP